MQQNPFNSQLETTLNSSLNVRDVGMRPLITVSGIPVRDATRRETGSSIFSPEDVPQLQVPFSDQLTQAVVLFPRSQRIQSNEEGIFVPKSLFGREAQIRFRQERRGDGGLQVVVYATSPQSQTIVRRRTEVIDCSLELQWLEEHGKEYAGLWVALEGEQLITSGVDGRQVYEDALAKGATRPFLVQVESSDELPFGGW
jgi:hypothetical protein